MDVFISWSGDKSHKAAVALRAWLPKVVQAIDPYMSSQDIYAGTRWQTEIAARLEATDFGIVCVTRANQREPWLSFEAGALAKSVALGRVVPLALDLSVSDIEHPLAQFQAKPASRAGLRETLASINDALEAPLDTGLLDETFDTWWPALDVQLKAIRQSPDNEPPGSNSARSDRALLEELVQTVRSLRFDMSQPPPADPFAALPSEHPLLGDLEDLILSAGFHSITLASRRGPRLVYDTDPPLPASIKQEMIRRAADFGVEIAFHQVEDMPDGIPY